MQNVTAAAPLWRNDPNYPGAPPEVLSKVQHRATVDYDTYVLRYQAAQRANALLTALGIAAVAAGIVALRGDATVMAVIVGIGLMAAGGVGLLTAATAHAEYKQMAVSVTETYAPRPEVKPTMARPFVASANTPKTIRVGRFNAEVLRALLATANVDSRLTRDAAVGKVPRTLYGDGKWGDTLAEVERLGYCDSDGRVTPAGWDFYYERPRSDAGRSDYTRPDGAEASGVGGVK